MQFRTAGPKTGEQNRPSGPNLDAAGVAHADVFWRVPSAVGRLRLDRDASRASGSGAENPAARHRPCARPSEICAVREGEGACSRSRAEPVTVASTGLGQPSQSLKYFLLLLRTFSRQPCGDVCICS